MFTSEAPSDRWYVSVGHRAIGPVKLSLVTRGVEAGRVPRGAFVRHEGWKVWRPVEELDGANAASLAAMTDEPPAASEDLVELLPLEESVAGLGWSEEELRDDLRVLLSAAVARSSADAALVQVLVGDRGVVVAAHGPDGGKELVGVSAAKGCASLLARLDGSLVGTRRIPITVGGRVVAVLQVGRRSLFTDEDLDSLETLAGSLAEKLAAVLAPDA